MTENTTATPANDDDLDLVLTRVVDVTPAQIWEAWTTPELLKQWFCPAPWKVVESEFDLRPGGIFRNVMRSPEGQDMDMVGCFLEVVPDEKLVFTDALRPGFRPSAAPFFTGIVTLEPVEGGTRYTARAMHKDAEGRKTHEEMGFHEGWGICLDRLVALMKRRAA